MLPEYRTIYRGGEDEIVEKKSRFIATVIPAETEEEALDFIEKQKEILGCHTTVSEYMIGGERAAAAPKVMMESQTDGWKTSADVLLEMNCEKM